MVPGNSDLHRRAAVTMQSIIIWCVHIMIGKQNLWNVIPLDVHEKYTAGSFKSALRKIFMSSYYLCNVLE